MSKETLVETIIRLEAENERYRAMLEKVLASGEWFGGALEFYEDGNELRGEIESVLRGGDS
jgi:hypothetical protein